MNFENLVREDKIDLPENLPTVKSVVEAQEVGMWDGAASAMADILPNVALNIGSTVTTGYFGSVGRAQIEAAAAEAQELGVPIEDPKRFAQDQETRARENAKEWRRLAREEYTPDPNATGIVAQVIHGVGTELGKAAAATVASLGNPAMAATLYGGMHGVETYNRLRDEGVDEDTALDAGVGAFASGTIGMALPGALGATRLRSAIYGATANPISNIAEDTTIRTILDNADYSKLAGAIDPFDPLNLAIASVVGGGFGAMGWRAPDRMARSTGTPDAAPEPAARAAESAAETPVVRPDAAARPEARVDAEQRPAARTETPAPAEGVRPSVASVDVEEVRRASSMRQSEGGVMLQNRNRGTFSSIAQMNAIAASPDYDRVSVSRDFAQGAPVVAFVHDIPDTQIGRVERVTASDGSKMSMHYAVMEAETILASNRVDGTRVEEYGTSDYHVTIAGNGRVAGITEAYRRGTAEKYKADMVSDAEAVGIDPKVIEGMRQPVLVRLMTDRDASRADIAQLSNETGTKGFDATEQAENDAASIDVAALAFDEEGNITPEAVAQFVALLPDNSGVIDRGGVPNNMARPRLERAIFQRVYGRPYLTSLLTDTEGGGRIVSVLMRVAPKMLQLEEAGDLDFRNDLVAAAIEIYEARAGGARMSLRELADQRPLGRTPETQAFLDYFAANPTKVNEPVRIFNELADWATANHYDPTSMFADESPVATRVDLMAEFADLAGVEVDPTVLAQIGATVSREQAIEKIRTRISEQLTETGMDTEQVEAQATLWTGAVMRLAAQNGIEPLDILPKIKVADGVGSVDSFGQSHGSLVDLTGEEIAPEGIEGKEVRRLAKEWYRRNLQGTSVTNELTGRVVKFAGSNKAISTSADVRKLRLFPGLPELIRKGQLSDLIPVSEDHPKAPNIKGYRWLSGKMRLADVLLDVGVTIREDNNGDLYYNHNILENETPLNSEFKPLTKQALEQRGDAEETSSIENVSFNLFVLQDRSLQGSFAVSENRITLTPNANITTFSHEMGHWWLANAVELSKRADVNPELRRDVRKLFDLWGVKDQADWDALGVDGQRRFHEQFASWVEEFLVTGHLPSPSLQGLLNKFRGWILSLYRDFRAHLNERYRSEFGEDLPELSDEVRDILERNLTYEDARETALREFNPTATAQDAARYAAYQRTVREDQPVDMSIAQELQESLFAEADAKLALDTGEKISIQAPVDVDRANGEVQRLRENLNMPESLELRAPDEGMLVHEIPTRTREEIEAARAEEAVGAAQEKIVQGFQELIGLPVEGEGAEAQARPAVSSEDARLERRAQSILEESPDMAVLVDGNEDVRSAADIMAEVERDAAEDDKFANLLETTAAECILKNRGI